MQYWWAGRRAGPTTPATAGSTKPHLQILTPAPLPAAPIFAIWLTIVEQARLARTPRTAAELPALVGSEIVNAH